LKVKFQDKFTNFLIQLNFKIDTSITSNQ